jgi:restriction system protein
MSIPDYQSIMLPLLRFANDGNEHTTRESIEHLANEFQLTQEERNEMLPSGKARLFDNRVGWASTYLRKALLIESNRKGYFHISERGKKVLEENPDKIDVNYLEQFSEFVEFRKIRKSKPDEKQERETITFEISPEESLETAYQELQESLASDLLQTIKDCSPEFFERLVIDVLVKMGYGGSRKEAGQAVGKSGDEGIDGIIKEDKLGLDIIYIQAKRWENAVGRPEIQKFAGALQGQRASKGIFITTSNFTKDAFAYVENIQNKIILIDGPRLAELMIDHNVGVAPVASYSLLRIVGVEKEMRKDQRLAQLI